MCDAYNANPTSMKAALDNFYRLEADNKMLILGEMRELGTDSLKEHQNIVQLIQVYGFKDVLLVGEEFIKTGCPFRCFCDVNALATFIQQQQPQDKTILIKGSNGTKSSSGTTTQPSSTTTRTRVRNNSSTSSSSTTTTTNTSTTTRTRTRTR